MKETKPEFKTKEGAYEALKIISQEDFGYDVDTWRTFFYENGPDITHKGYPEFIKLLKEIRMQREQNKDNESEDS